jgi:hypothetical protein
MYGIGVLDLGKCVGEMPSLSEKSHMALSRASPTTMRQLLFTPLHNCNAIAVLGKCDQVSSGLNPPPSCIHSSRMFSSPREDKRKQLIPIEKWTHIVSRTNQVITGTRVDIFERLKQEKHVLVSNRLVGVYSKKLDQGSS